MKKLLERAKVASPSVQHNDVSFIPEVFPSGLPADLALIAGGKYPPPSKGFYDDKVLPEQRYLWRWVAMYGATLVIDVRAAEEPGHWASEDVSSDQLTKLLEGSPLVKKLEAPRADHFVRQIAEKGIEDVGQVPTLLIKITVGSVPAELEAVENILSSPPPTKSSALKELKRREARTPRDLATDLTVVYGHDLKQVAYIPVLAVIGRLRSAEATKDEKELSSLQTLLSPFAKGEQNPVPRSGSDQAGHLLFAEMAKRSEGKERERWIELCKAAADQAFFKNGEPQPLMPYHNEMSDAVFMATPILCATGTLTGEKKYFDAAVVHFRNMKKLCLREDGLYRHSPLDEAAWGRGNGFPALGLAWALSEFPEDRAEFAELKKDFQNHIAALLKHQDHFGCWHQVIDKPGSYREFSATAMIGWAMKRGIDRGWLDKKEYQPALDWAWQAAKQRIVPKGVIVDICTGTGKQKSLRDYYDRPAIWGVDARGGAMALMFATEMMNAEKP
ncbi:glycoside hydrolase family 88 protein [Anatilimnocola floriformis]|uniref:glycoside hydrolase family 88 protein n=1 Tax=Anatilimnocola floriformis TaxID=2948575 RepID=UPI0020C588BD|nr:glycoside hydrolase family 88 protein [Anatilimnocola floriformis]